LGEELSVLEDCITKYIIPHVYSFAYYQYTNIRHFGTHCNNGVEGGHYAYKNAAISVSTQDSLCAMDSKLIDHNELRIGSNQTTTTPCQTWSSSKTSTHVVRTTEYELMTVKLRAPDYSCRRLSLTSWEVAHKDYEQTDHIPTNNVVPSFRRRRTVQMTSDGFMSCSCKKFETCGLGCSHILCAFNSLNNSSAFEYEVTDVSCIWYNIYSSCPVNEYCRVWRALKNLRDNDVKGPRMKDYEKVLLLHPQSLLDPLLRKFKCVNYPVFLNDTASQFGRYTQITGNIRDAKISHKEVCSVAEDDQSYDGGFIAVGNKNVMDGNVTCSIMSPCVLQENHNKKATKAIDRNSYADLFGHFKHLV